MVVWLIASPRVPNGRPLTPPASCLVSAPRGLAMSQATKGRGYHIPVMVEAVAELMKTITDGVVVDATYGGGGHTERLLEDLPSSVVILGLDRDPDAINRARTGAAESERLRLLQANFGDLEEKLNEAGIGRISGALFDLGVSSHQLDEAERGFSFRRTGPLDMRMGPDAASSAEEAVNEWPQDQLGSVIARYGEERFAKRIARAIVARRPISDTTELAEIVRQAIPAATRRRGGHPARRTFQALRIAVNDELTALERGLDTAVDRLDVGGRCVVISYHSLEDRIVKQRFVAGAAGCICPPDLPVCGCGQAAELIVLTRKPMTPTEGEVAFNRRARAAKLRAAEKAA